MTKYAVDAATRRIRFKRKLKLNLWCWMFMSLAVGFYILFQGYPIICSIQYSLLDWSGMTSNGEGIHHIAFQVDDADEVAKRLQEEMGATFEQEGNYGDGSGKYIYLLCEETLKCRLELLQSFNK